MKEIQSSREAVAHHEAGHAAAMVVLKIPLEYVTIKADDNRYGHVASLPHTCPIQDELCMLMAGAHAEARYTGDQIQARLNALSSIDGDGDLEAALLAQVEASLRPEVEAAASRDAHRLVNDFAPDFIDAIATALLKRETLSAEDVRQIFDNFNDTGDRLIFG